VTLRSCCSSNNYGQDVDLVLRDARGYELNLQFDDVTTIA